MKISDLGKDTLIIDKFIEPYFIGVGGDQYTLYFRRFLKKKDSEEEYESIKPISYHGSLESVLKTIIRKKIVSSRKIYTLTAYVKEMRLIRIEIEKIIKDSL